MSVVARPRRCASSRELVRQRACSTRCRDRRRSVRRPTRRSRARRGSRASRPRRARRPRAPARPRASRARRGRNSRRRLRAANASGFTRRSAARCARRRKAAGCALAARRASVDVVRDQHQRRAVLAIQREQQIADRRAGALVEIAGRLVGEQELGLVHERARERDALLLAAGKLVRIVMPARIEPDAARAPRARARAASPRPSSSSGSITFSSAFSAGSRWKLWNTKPTRRRRRRARASSSSASRRWPARLIVPALGRSSPASRPSSVVLPEPDAPTIARLAPRATSRLTPSRIVSRPSGPSTVLLTSSRAQHDFGIGTHDDRPSPCCCSCRSAAASLRPRRGRCSCSAIRCRPRTASRRSRLGASARDAPAAIEDIRDRS